MPFLDIENNLQEILQQSSNSLWGLESNLMGNISISQNAITDNVPRYSGEYTRNITL